MTAATPYSTEFFQRQRQGSLDSAREVLRIVQEYIAPSSVIDIGCGTGTWLSVLRELGVSDVWGVDGAHVDRSMLLIPEDRFIVADLTQPLKIDRRFDLAISLEVGEHLPSSVADNFVAGISALAPVVLFSAAIPFQGGTFHINEQWQTYWIERYAAHGFRAIDCIRPQVWQNPRVVPCYAQNTLLFVHESALARFPRLQPWAQSSAPPQAALVHPSLYLDKVDPARLSFREAWGMMMQVARRRVRARLSGSPNRAPRS